MMYVTSFGRKKFHGKNLDQHNLTLEVLTPFFLFVSLGITFSVALNSLTFLLINMTQAM